MSWLSRWLIWTRGETVGGVSTPGMWDVDVHVIGPKGLQGSSGRLVSLLAGISYGAHAAHHGQGETL